MKTSASVLDLLLEMQSLDRVPRLGYAMRGVADPESVSEHEFHVVFLVWVLARREPEIDAWRAVQLALVHDLGEVRFGDLPRPAAHYLAPGAKHDAERRAVDDLLAPIGGDDGLLAEYQACRTREARFVAICDKLQLLLKATVYRSWGYAGVDELTSALTAGGQRAFDDGGFESIAEVAKQLRQYSAGSGHALDV